MFRYIMTQTPLKNVKIIVCVFHLKCNFWPHMARLEEMLGYP